MDANSDICADFLVEAREILDQLGEQMVVLEHTPDDSEGLNAVFRGFHTIKGGAGFLDFAPMVKLCHAFEDRLNLARTGELPLDAVAFDGAQQAIDLLVDMIDAVASGEPLPEAPQALIDSLHPDAAAPAPSAPAIPAELLEGDLDDLDFDALLDSLHGSGGVPGAPPPAPSPSPSPSPSPAPAPAPAPPPAPPPKPAAQAAPKAPAAPEEQTVRVDVRRLDAMVNLVGEMVLARNRLKTLRPRL